MKEYAKDIIIDKDKQAGNASCVDYNQLKQLPISDQELQQLMQAQGSINKNKIKVIGKALKPIQ